MSTSIRCCKIFISAIVLHFSQAAREHERSQAVGRSIAPQTVEQAWKTFCSANDCSQSAAPPGKAYLISLPEDSAKRQHLEQALHGVSGLGLSVEIISAIPSDQLGDLWEYLECKPASTAYDCQAGLTRSHIEAWRRLAKSGEPAAWIFEDDAVFHDRFLTLFPEYWHRVPSDFQFVFAGHVYWGSVWDNATVHVGPRTSAWGTHAYIIDAETAERLALLGSHMIERARRHASQRSGSWQLDGHDIKIDHFIKVYYDSLLPLRHRQRWAVFESPTKQPWSFEGVRAAHSNDCNCNCDAIEQCLKDGKAPLTWPNGLVAQHNCRNNVDRLQKWHKEIQGLPRSRLCNSTKEGRSEHLDMPQLPLLLHALKPASTATPARHIGSSQQQ